MEYLVDHASPETRAAGEVLLQRELYKYPDGPQKKTLFERIERIRHTDDRDLYF
jgi:2-iminoacetate synthase